jgi:hypothetical protein
MMDVEQVARALIHMASLPLDANVWDGCGYNGGRSVN